MSDLMAVLLNGVAQLELNRRKPITDDQAAFLERMDRKMEAGIDLDGRRVTAPDLGQRAQFVAANLAHAIRTGNEAQCAALTTWLAVRLTDLKQVKIREQGEDFTIELVFDEDYVKQYPVTFGRPL
jgi:hypothetical protein